MRLSKIFIAITAIALLSASCNPFGTKTAGGFIKTSNGGADWQFSNQVKTDLKATMGGLSISAMTFNPKNSDEIFASSFNDGVFKSEDGGTSWQRILSKFLVYDIVIHPENPDIIYAAGSFADHGRVVVTRDGGKSWNEIFNEASLGNQVRSITTSRGLSGFKAIERT